MAARMSQVVAAVAEPVVRSRSGSGVVAIGIDSSGRYADTLPFGLETAREGGSPTVGAAYLSWIPPGRVVRSAKAERTTLRTKVVVHDGISRAVMGRLVRPACW